MNQPKLEDYKPIRLSRLEWHERARIFGSSRITLCQRPDGELGRQYLTRERGLDLETIARFRMGFVPFTINHPFSGRIVMPIMDAYGELLALSLRPVINGVEPKYWNESFVKGENLYGLWLAKYAICQVGFAIIVEGQIDVCSMHAHGFANTVGLLGGAFTPVQSQILRRWTRQFVLLMDADAAGRKHAERALEIFENFQCEGRGKKRAFKYAVAELPVADDSNDPAKFLRTHGSGEMRKLLVNTMSSSGLKVPRELT